MYSPTNLILVLLLATLYCLSGQDNATMYSYEKMNISHLRQFLKHRGVKVNNSLEKGDFMKLAIEHSYPSTLWKKGGISDNMTQELHRPRRRKAHQKATRSSTPAKIFKEEAEVLMMVQGDTVLSRLKKYADIKSSGVLPEVEANKLRGVIGNNRRIAICLVIVDKLHHEEIWRRWMDQSAESGYQASFHIHAKYPDRISSPWVKKHTLSKTFFPNWNSPEVIRALLAVISDALQSFGTGRLILGTESCIPIRTLQETGDQLFADEKSWLQAYHKGKNPFEQLRCFRAVNGDIIPAEYVWKSIPGWVMLTRKHAEAIISLPEKMNCTDLVTAWDNVFAPEEVFFPTMLALLGYLRDPSGGPDEVTRQMSTFSEWKNSSVPNPTTFPALTSDLLSVLRGTGALFARKFRAGAVSVDQWDIFVRIAAADARGQ